MPARFSQPPFRRRCRPEEETDTFEFMECLLRSIQNLILPGHPLGRRGYVMFPWFDCNIKKAPTEDAKILLMAFIPAPWRRRRACAKISRTKKHPSRLLGKGEKNPPVAHRFPVWKLISGPSPVPSLFSRSARCFPIPPWNHRAGPETRHSAAEYRNGFLG